MSSQNASDHRWIVQLAALNAVVLLLALAIVAAWHFGGWPQFFLIFLVAVLIAGGAIVVLRSAVAQVFGPVFLYDIVRLTRRGTLIAHRCLYALLLFCALYLVFFFRFPHVGIDGLFENVSMQRSEVPKFANAFFSTFLAIQILAVLLVTPAYTAGVIADEKQRRTLEFLLSTDLTNGEIVLGILAARLATLALLILTGLPILGFLQFLGGVDPNLVLAGFAVTLLTMVSLGAVCILASVFNDRPIDAIRVSYLWMFPFIGMFSMVAWSIIVGGPDEASRFGVLLGLLVLYAGYHLLVAYFCAYWAVSSLRRATLGTERPTRRRPPSPTRPRPVQSGWGYLEVPVVMPAPPVLPRTMPARHRRRPRIGQHPMIWKELGPALADSEVFRGCAYGAGILFLLPMFVAFIYLIWYEETVGRYVNQLVRVAGMLVGGASMLFAALNASGRITREREQQTLESLFTTTLADHEILLGKWLASVFSVRIFWFGLLLIWGFGLFTGGLNLFALPLVLAAYVVYLVCLSSLGLWFSMVSRSTLRAILFTLLASLALMAGPGLMGKTLGYHPGPQSWAGLLGEHASMPLLTMWTLSFYTGDLLSEPTSFDRIMTAVLSLYLYMGLTVLLWLSMLRRLRELGPRPKQADADRDSVAAAAAERRSTDP